MQDLYRDGNRCIFDKSKILNCLNKMIFLWPVYPLSPMGSSKWTSNICWHNQQFPGGKNGKTPKTLQMLHEETNKNTWWFKMVFDGQSFPLLFHISFVQNKIESWCEVEPTSSSTLWCRGSAKDVYLKYWYDVKQLVC